MKNTANNTRKSKRFFSLILSVVLVLGALFVIPVSSASAATTTKTFVTYQDPDYGTSGKYVGVADITGRKVSPSQVKSLKATNGVKVKVDYAHTNKFAMIYVIPNQNFLGTTKVSFKIGNTSYSFNYTAKKYVNPASTFTIDGVSQLSQLNKHLLAHSGADNGIHKVTIKAKSGWKFTHIGAMSNKWFLNRDFNTTSFNARIDNFRFLKVTFQNTSNGAYVVQNIDMMNYSGK